MINKAFDATETFGEREQVGVLEESPRSRQIGLQDNGHHASEGAHLFLRQVVLRMLCESGVINLFDLRFLLQPARNLQCVLAVTFHSQRERLQSAQSEETVERSGNGA